MNYDWNGISYAALGLLANSNAASNPTEIETDKEPPTSHQATASSQDSTTQPTPQLAAAASTKPSLPKGKGRLIRDSTGVVIGVDLPEDDESDAMNSNDRTVRREKDEDTPWGAPMTEDRPIVPVTAKTSVVRGQFPLIYFSTELFCRINNGFSPADIEGERESIFIDDHIFGCLIGYSFLPLLSSLFLTLSFSLTSVPGLPSVFRMMDFGFLQSWRKCQLQHKGKRRLGQHQNIR